MFGYLLCQIIIVFACVREICSYDFLEKKDSKIYAAVGSDIRLKCPLAEAKSRIKPRDIRLHFGSKENSYNFVQGNEAIFIIKNVTKGHSGTYQCKISTKNSVIRRIRLIVDNPLSEKNVAVKCRNSKMNYLYCRINLDTSIPTTYLSQLMLKHPDIKNFYEDYFPSCLTPICTFPFEKGSQLYGDGKLTFELNVKLQNALGQFNRSYAFENWEIIRLGQLNTFQIKSESFGAHLSWQYPPSAVRYNLQNISNFSIRLYDGKNPSIILGHYQTQNLYFHLSKLKPYTKYIVGIAIFISTNPAKVSKNMYKTEKFSTKPALPNAPELIGYEISSSNFAKESLVVYWNPIRPEDYNGPNFSYKLPFFGRKLNSKNGSYCTDIQGYDIEPESEVDIFLNKYTQFQHIITGIEHYSNFTVHLYAINNVGASKNYSLLTADRYESVKKVANISVLQIELENNRHKILWDMEDRQLNKYDLITCQKAPIGGNDCIEPPIVSRCCPMEYHSKDISNPKIGLRMRSLSNLIIWSECVLMISDASTMYLLLDGQLIDDHDIALKYKLKCPSMRLYVDHFKVRYCNVIARDFSCQQITETQLDLKRSEYLMTDLSYNTLYKIQLITALKDGKIVRSRSIFVQTSRNRRLLINIATLVLVTISIISAMIYIIRAYQAREKKNAKKIAEQWSTIRMPGKVLRRTGEGEPSVENCDSGSQSLDDRIEPYRASNSLINNPGSFDEESPEVDSGDEDQSSQPGRSDVCTSAHTGEMEVDLMKKYKSIKKDYKSQLALINASYPQRDKKGKDEGETKSLSASLGSDYESEAPSSNFTLAAISLEQGLSRCRCSSRSPSDSKVILGTKFLDALVRNQTCKSKPCNHIDKMTSSFEDNHSNSECSIGLLSSHEAIVSPHKSVPIIPNNGRP